MWDFLSGIGRGLGKIGSGITSGVKKLPGLGGEGGATGAGAPAPLPRPNATFTTPSFNPAAKGGIESLNVSKGQAPIPPVLAQVRPSYEDSVLGMRKAAPTPDATPLLPSASAMPSMPLPRPDNSAVGVPIPQLPGYKGDPIPYNPTEKARYDYVMEGAKRDEGGRLLGKAEGGGFKRSGKDILMNSLIGGLQGSSDGRGLGGFIGGAAVGGIGSTVSPQKGREYRFKNEQEPQLLAQQGRQDAELQRQRQIENQGLDIKLKQGQIANYESLNKDRDLDRELQRERFRMQYEPKPPAPPKPMTLSPGQVVIDPSTGKQIFAHPAANKPESITEQMRQVETEMEDTEGPVDEIARSSTENRLPSIIESLPTQFRTILQTGKMPDGSEPLPEDLLRAEQALAAAKERDWQANRSTTRATRKQKVRQQVYGGAKPLPKAGGANVAPRNVNDLLKYLR